MPTQPHWLWGLVAPVGLALPAQAAEVMQLPSVTVHGDRPVFSPHPQAVTTLTRDQLLRSGASNLAQLLRAETAIAVRQYGPVGSLATVSLRGALGEGVLILRDGVKLNSPERGGVDLSTISLLGVERVEILAGGASATYGAEAVGGVIHLISARKPPHRVEGGLGQFGQRFLKAETGAVQGDTSIVVGVNRIYADNDHAFTYRNQTSPRRNAQLDATELVLNGKTRLGSAYLDLGLTAARHDKGVPGPINYPSPLATQRDDVLTGSARWVQPWGELTQTTALSHQHTRLIFSDPRSIYQKTSDSRLDSTDLQTALSGEAETHLWTAGVGLTRDTVTGQSVGTRERFLGALFAHDEWLLGDRWTAFGDFRLDHHAAFGFNPSPRLGLTYQFTPSSRLRGVIGRSYRAPTFNDLYWPSLGSASGNATLMPETTTQFELGWDHLAGPLTLKPTLFWNRGTNVISWLPGTGGVWTPVNIGQTDIKGLELEASYVAAPFRWVGAATGLSALDLSGQVGKTLLYRPDWTARSAIAYAPTPAFDLTLTWDYLGKRFTTAQNTDALAPVGLWSLRASYAVFAADRLTVGVDNLADKAYELQPYYPMPGRQATVSWSHSF
ncbi:Vitamin B12 transporter BtuB precursor [compost metagenome]